VEKTDNEIKPLEKIKITDANKASLRGEIIK
jgi:hypothetical protein